MNNDCIVIGIDPGSRFLGYALIEKISERIHLRLSGVIRFEKKDSLQKKLVYVFYYFKNIIAQYAAGEGKVVFFSIERQYCDKNTQSAFVLVSFYSIFLLLAEMEHTDCIVMMPSQIKKYISGSGGCSKEDVLRVIQDELNVDISVFSLDESDAIAIALSGMISLGAKNTPPALNGK